jgi:hypothetical protein
MAALKVLFMTHSSPAAAYFLRAWQLRVKGASMEAAGGRWSRRPMGNALAGALIHCIVSARFSLADRTEADGKPRLRHRFGRDKAERLQLPPMMHLPA